MRMLNREVGNHDPQESIYVYKTTMKAYLIQATPQHSMSTFQFGLYGLPRICTQMLLDSPLLQDLEYTKGTSSRFSKGLVFKSKTKFCARTWP